MADPASNYYPPLDGEAADIACYNPRVTGTN